MACLITSSCIRISLISLIVLRWSSSGNTAETLTAKNAKVSRRIAKDDALRGSANRTPHSSDALRETSRNFAFFAVTLETLLDASSPTTLTSRFPAYNPRYRHADRLADLVGDEIPPPPKKRYDPLVIEGPVAIVWKLAWPTMLTNIFGVAGNYRSRMVGTTSVTLPRGDRVATDRIVVIVFIMSVFTGMSVLAPGFVQETRQGRPHSVPGISYRDWHRGVHHGRLSSISQRPLARYGKCCARVQQKLCLLPDHAVFSGGMLVFFMLSGALRSAATLALR